MDVIIIVIVLVFSAILHEVMHGFVADKLGDPTARIMGRLTLNPIPHIDPIGSIIMPLLTSLGGITFGWAKPVPINPLYFKDGRKDMALVALSGPLTNFILAIIGAIFFNIIPTDLILIKIIFYFIVRINLVLGILNLIPIPPLDGSKVFSIFLPDDLAKTYFSLEQYGTFILLFLLFFPIGGINIGVFISRLVIIAMQFLKVPLLF